jgi:anti-sigma factor RsiW
VGAFAGSLATVLAWFVATAVIDGRATDERTSEAVTAHVRATLGNHLIAVASSDLHTVKPWLSARLDYSVPVIDVPAEGFTLAGGRLDYLEGRPVATLVYHYRLHVVDVFVRPQTGRAFPQAAQTVRGFHTVFATGNGMEWIVVSDASTEALSRLATGLAQGSP